MRIQNATITAIKADIAKAELAVTIKVRLNQETMATAQELSNYTGEDPTRMDVDLWPHQLRLFNEAGVPPTIIGETDIPEDHESDDEPESDLAEEHEVHIEGWDAADPEGDKTGVFKLDTDPEGTISITPIDPDSEEGNRILTLLEGELPLTDDERIHLKKVKKEIDGSWEPESEEK